MKIALHLSRLALPLLLAQPANAAFTLSLSSDDIAVTSVYNTVTSFRIDITIDETLAAGTVYNNPALVEVDYQVIGSLPDPTPSGFSGFVLNRTIPGATFYGLSPTAALNFSVSAGADLSDGLQFDELSGTGTQFIFDARELNQNPGRYHPPVLTLSDNGTGTLANSNNMSTFPNPDPPVGSGQLVDVSVGEEYNTTLTFATNLTLAPVPEPSSLLLLSGALCSGLLIRRRS